MGSGTHRAQPDAVWREKPLPRVPLLGVLVGTAVLIVGLMSLYLVMRTLGLDYGGACAVDGPYQIRPGQECEPGIFTSAYVSIAISVTGGLLLLWSSRRYDAGLVSWAAVGTLATLFFGALGVSFRKVAAALPASAEGISDFNAVGVVFVVLAVLPSASPWRRSGTATESDVWIIPNRRCAPGSPGWVQSWSACPLDWRSAHSL